MKQTFRKADLVEAMASTQGISKTEAEKAVARTFDGLKTIASKMELGDSLQLVGLITLEVSERKERVGSHPKTKEKIVIPGKKYLKAKMGKVYQDIVAE